MKIIFLLILAFFCLQQVHAQAIPADSASDRIFTLVEVESYFPGGTRAWLQFLNEHLKYPKKAIRKNIQGTVVLQFIVGKDGSVSDLTALSGDPLLIQAALDAMKETPKWKPAMQNGRLVKSYKKQPIVFKLEG